MPLQAPAPRPPLTRDHRGAQQELTGARGIRRNGAQPVEIALAHFRIAASSRFLFSIDCSCTNSTRPSAADGHRRRGVCRALHQETMRANLSARLTASWITAVEPHAADRVVDVGRVAGEQHAALAEGRGDALVRRVEIAVERPRKAAVRGKISAARPAPPHRWSVSSSDCAESVGNTVRPQAQAARRRRP